MFLHVWLRRQEIEVTRVRLFAQGMADPQYLNKSFKDYTAAVYPWLKQSTTDSDKKMMEAVEREVARGAIAFNPLPPNVLKDAVDRYSAPDDFRQRLAAAAAKRKGRK